MQQFVWTQNIYSSSEAATTAFPVTTQQVACCGDSCLIFSLQFNIRYLRAFIILIWRYLHFNCLLLGENYLLLTCVPIHETVSGNPILLGGSDGPNLLKLVCVVASPRPNTELEKSLVWSLISPLINLFLNYPESCWKTVNTSLIFHLSDGGWIRFSWDRWEREKLGRELDWME